MTTFPDLMAPAIKTSTSTPKFLVRAAIQGKLLSLPGTGMFTDAIRLSATNDLNECVKMILNQAKNNRGYMVEIIGEDLLKEIEKL